MNTAKGNLFRTSTALMAILLASLLMVTLVGHHTRPAEAQSAPQEASSVAAWGYNSDGQLNDGTRTNRNAPVQAGTATDWKDVSAGGLHSLATKNDGTLWAWGQNLSGQLGDGTNASKYTPVQIGTDTDWKDVSAGDAYSLAIKNNGTLWAWGFNAYGQLGDGTNTSRYTPVQVGTETDWQDVSAGNYHSLAIKKDGTARAWGWNVYGQLGDRTTTDRNAPVEVSGLTDVKAVSAGTIHSLAIKNDGTARAWGDNFYGQLGDRTNTRRNAPVQVGTDTDWKDVSAGGLHSLAIKNDGTARAWGYNRDGELGDRTNTPKYAPVEVSGLTDVKDVAAGDYHSLAIKNDGTARAWGDNFYGQLGDGTNTARNAPVEVSGLTDVKDVDAGAYHSLAVRGPLDDTAPETSIASTSPSGTINNNKPIFTFSGSDNKTPTASLQYSYKVDDGQWSSYSTTTSATLGGSSGLSDGEHTFSVSAKDAAGNVDASPAEQKFAVDTTAPATTISTGPSGPIKESMARFAFSSDDENATFECSLDNGDGSSTYEECNSPQEYSNLTDGSYTFSVMATDKVGNVEKDPVPQQSFEVDTEAPTVTIDTAPPATTNSKAAELSFSSDEANVTFECSLDGVAYPACTSPVTYNGLSDGSHTFDVKATDAAGNSSTKEGHTWTIDATAPSVTIKSGPSGTTNSKTAEFAFDSSEQGSSFKCSTDGTTYTACTSPYTYSSTPLQDGSYTFYVKATDAAGNPGAVERQWTVDSKADAPTGLDLAEASDKGKSNTDNITNINRPTFSGKAEADAKVELYDGTNLLGSTTANASGDWTFTIPSDKALDDATHSITAKATDSLGNVSDPSGALSVKVDTTRPTVTQVSPTNGQKKTSKSTNVTATFSEEMNEDLITTGTSTSSFKLEEVRKGVGTLISAVTLKKATDTSGITTATLDPNSDLKPRVYRATITTGGAQDIAGNSLSQDYAWGFSVS